MTKRNMTSEWVSIGHPDKVADFISEYILDRYIEQDPKTRYALECQIKDNYVTLGGEITSKVQFSALQMQCFVKKAVETIGYTAEYAAEWKEQCTNAQRLEITCHISQQSPDIAQGVNRGGWGDQGIFWGMAVPTPETDYMPMDIFLARRIGRELYERRIGGIDIKTQVTLDGTDTPEVVVAIPLNSSRKWLKPCIAYIVEENVRQYIGNANPRITINGTGEYQIHGSVGDCGTTGRKLAVDFYGGNCEIGGGCPWTKDGTKADLALNMYARKAALDYMVMAKQAVKVALSCRIGSPIVAMTVMDLENHVLEESTQREIRPEEIMELFRLDTPRFTSICMEGLPYAAK